MPKVTVNDSKGLVQETGAGMHIDSRLYLGDGQTTVLGANGSIPVTASYVKVDAGGSARTGIRFAGTGDAGQLIVVHNAGGEALTFHNTASTALVRGIHADNDTMEALGTYMFVSDGAQWCFIGGSEATNVAGLTAS